MWSGEPLSLPATGWRRSASAGFQVLRLRAERRGDVVKKNISHSESDEDCDGGGIGPHGRVLRVVAASEAVVSWRGSDEGEDGGWKNVWAPSLPVFPLPARSRTPWAEASARWCRQERRVFSAFPAALVSVFSLNLSFSSLCRDLTQIGLMTKYARPQSTDLNAMASRIAAVRLQALSYSLPDEKFDCPWRKLSGTVYMWL